MAIVCPECPQDACCHFRPLSPDPFLKKDADMALAKFGHLNHIIDMLCCISDTVAALGAILSGTATLDFPNTLTQTSSDLTITVAGAVVGNAVSLGTPAAPNANSSYTAFVSAADTVTVRFNNYSAGAINPASGSFTVKVFQ